MGTLFTNHKVPSIQSESVLRSSSKGSIYSYADTRFNLLNGIEWGFVDNRAAESAGKHQTIGM